MNKRLRITASVVLAAQLSALPLAPAAALAESFSYSGLSANPSRTYSGVGQQPGMPSYGLPLDTYFTDSSGNILMYVNVLGEVTKPGQYIVRQEADFGTLLSVVGGAKKSANLKKTKLMRYRPDKREQMTYTVDLDAYMEEGTRGQFVELKPNDTVIFPEDKGISFGDVTRYTGFGVSLITLLYLINRK